MKQDEISESTIELATNFEDEQHAYYSKPEKWHCEMVIADEYSMKDDRNNQDDDDQSVRYKRSMLNFMNSRHHDN